MGAGRPPARDTRPRRTDGPAGRPTSARTGASLLARYDLSRDELDGHVTTRKGRTEFLASCRCLRSLHPSEVRIAIVLDDCSPHLTG